MILFVIEVGPFWETSFKWVFLNLFLNFKVRMNFISSWFWQLSVFHMLNWWCRSEVFLGIFSLFLLILIYFVYLSFNFPLVFNFAFTFLLFIDLFWNQIILTKWRRFIFDRLSFTFEKFIFNLLRFLELLSGDIVFLIWIERYTFFRLLCFQFFLAQ